ncbi:agmatinase [Candidatus Woesearchaeota archaeon]|nr:agmatinase [Candidatus Woesearchaeota archaeon]
MEYVSYPDNFFGLVDPLSNYESSKAVILQVPYEKTTTFMRGTKNGPKAILKSSVEVQPYDEEMEKNICEAGICTLKPLKAGEEPEEMMENICNKIKKLAHDSKFPVIVGGEHSITPACIKAFSDKYDNLSVLQIDAHTDLADEWDGTKYSHACALRRCFEITRKIIPVGIRSTTMEEVEFAAQNGIKIFWAKDVYDNDEWHDDAIARLSDDVYITIDLDGFDPSIMPSVGTPEPGGMQYYPTLRFLKKVFNKRNVIGFDVVELCPNEKEASSDFTAAKLIYKLIGYKFFKGL